MGIPKFFSWYRNYNGTKDSVKPKRILRNIICHVLAIDLNGFIYKHQNNFEGIWSDIQALVVEVKPTQKLILAIDGVAPVAKMQQQRSRRFLNAPKSISEVNFDTNQISPGTDFMKRLDIFLEEKVRMMTNQQPFPGLIVYSSHLDPGEGEHKIVKFLKKNKHEKQNLVVHGADADLILIYTLLLKNSFENIYIYREVTLPNLRTMIDIIDLGVLNAWLETKFKSTFPSDDFLVLMTIIGNDFLPHFPTLEHIPRVLGALVESYSKWTYESDKYICGCARINWSNFFEFFNHFYITSHPDIYEAWRNNTPLANERWEPFQRPSEIQILAGKNEKYESLWYSKALTGKSGYVASKKQIVDMSISYLQGIQWVYYYYVLGEHAINKDWYYPYRYTPLFKHMITAGSKLLHKTNLWEQVVVSKMESYRSTHEQLAMIMPPQSIRIIPREIQALFTENSPIRDLYPTKFLIDETGKQVDYMKIPFIPFAEPFRVNYAIKYLNIQKISHKEPFISFKVERKRYGGGRKPYSKDYRQQSKQKNRQQVNKKPQNLFR